MWVRVSWLSDSGSMISGLVCFEHMLVDPAVNAGDLGWKACEDQFVSERIGPALGLIELLVEQIPS